MHNPASVVSPSTHLQERYLGCLLGGAAGDALGAPVEFLDRAEIARQFGPGGVTELAPAYGPPGKITDDTQMTLFTGEGLLRAWVRGWQRGITTYEGVTAAAYQRWLITQGEGNLHGLHRGADGWLIRQPELHACRAPGSTCLEALRNMGSLGEMARNDSKGCGGLMRVAPVGLIMARLGIQDPVQEAFRLGASLCGLTHGHPTGQLAGGAFAAIICALATGSRLQAALAAAKNLLRTRADHTETLTALEAAETYAREGGKPVTSIFLLGEGWVAEEALAIAVYCALVAGDFREGVTMAVNHDGDSDSTGSIAGNLLGLIHGREAIPPHWLACLELREVIAQLARDLHDFPACTQGTAAPWQSAFLARYPGD